MEPHCCLFCQLRILSGDFCSISCEQKFEWRLKERELIQKLVDAALEWNDEYGLDRNGYTLALACNELKKHRGSAPK